MGLKPGFGRLAALGEALEVLMGHLPALASETVELRDALDRVLAEPIEAPIDVPHFAKAAMDGYAVLAGETFGASDASPKRLTVAGALSPGARQELRVRSGHCVEISTGAPMPEGADAVVMVEYTEPAEKNRVTIRKGVGPGDNVIKPASDIRKGEQVLDSGIFLKPPQIGVLAAMGLQRVQVVSRPLVGLFSTGPELKPPGQDLGPGEIYDINVHTLRAALAADGFDVFEVPTVPDELEPLKAAIGMCLERSDLVLLSGGSSLGGSDLVVEAFAAAGKVLIHGVAVKPGKPLVIGAAEGPARDGSGRVEKLMIGLPGYPMSALSDYYVFVQPWLRRAMGARSEARFTDAILARKHPSVLGRYEFLPVVLENGQAHPITRGSSSISALASADGFVEVHENIEVLEQGRPVRVRMF